MITERIEDNIVIATFDNGKHNTITLETLRQLQAIVKKVTEDDALKGIVLTGAGKVFCSGFDLPMFLAFKDIHEVVGFFKEEEPILLDLFCCPKPVIAAINGHAVAGGMIFSMACDYRLMKDHPKLKIGMSEIKIGLPLSVTQSAVVRYGLDSDRKYRDVLYFGEMYDIVQARELGMVDEVVAEEQLIPRAKELVCRFIDQPGRAFMKLKEGMRKPTAEKVRAWLADGEWQAGLQCFFDPTVRATLEFVQKMM